MSHCSSCGQPIPEGQGSSCSMCYGDIEYGKDGYYAKYIEELQQEIQKTLGIPETPKKLTWDNGL